MALFGLYLMRIAAAAIVNLNDAPSPPCGACRQVLAEFIDPEAPVSFPADRSGVIPLQCRLPALAELLPIAATIFVRSKRPAGLQ